MRKTIVLLLSLTPFIACRGAPRTPLTLDGERIRAVAAMLPAEPRSVGHPITERSRWDALRSHEAFKKVIPDAEKLLKESIPAKPDELYLDFSKTGNRSRWERVNALWYRRLQTLFFAECLENQGRFIPALEAIVTAYCDERSWVMPAHDASLRTWKGEFAYADLKACEMGMALATVRHVMGDRLKPALRARIKEEVIRRNLDPFKKQVTGKESLTWWWITCNHNWNAVCLAGITGAALTLIDNPEERALYGVAAEAYSKFFLSGFTPDGYCSEGMGYWNYGYGHYVMLTEFIWQATAGRVDLLQSEGARAAARYAGVLEIQSGIHPAFADCSIGSRPDASYMHYLSRRYGFGFAEWDHIDTASPGGMICSALLFSFPNSAERSQPAEPAGPRLEKRTWFPDAGVLICRPGENAASTLAVALKGGHNAEHHNHNDVGTYLVVNGGEALLVDPGAEVYTRRTFSGARYESKVLNSFGHPVPLVAGKMQEKGAQARGVVVKHAFTEGEDRIIFDLKSAYKVAELESLHRIFRYSRTGAGAFSVTDRVVFSSPQSFETALVTLSQWSRADENTLVFRDLDEGLRVVIETEGGAFTIDSEILDEDVRTRTQPERIAIRMTTPVKEAVIKITVTPDDFRKTHGPSTLFNGGFEQGAAGWRIRDGFSTVQSVTAASGKAALRITDNSKSAGSDMLSSRVTVTPGQPLTLSGKHHTLSGGGVGIYVYYYDGADTLLNPVSSQGHITPLLTLQGGQLNRWESFSAPFTPPPSTAYIRLWIHSFNAAVVDCLIDDLKISD